jgi:cytochrome c biogenesis protein ResB
LLVLDDFESVQYENGRPRDWISYLTIKNGDEILFDSAPLRVNHPIALDGFSLYQISYGTTTDGEEFSVIQAIRDPGFTLVVVSFIIIGFGIFITLIVKLRRTHE